MLKPTHPERKGKPAIVGSTRRTSRRSLEFSILRRDIDDLKRQMAALQAEGIDIPPALFKDALDYMGDAVMAKQMLLAPHWMLNGRSLAELARDSADGLQQALQMIGRARAGVAV